MDEISLIIKIDYKDFQLIKYNNATNNPICPISQEEIVRKIANGTPCVDDCDLERKEKVGKWLWIPFGYSCMEGTIGDWCCSKCKKVILNKVPRTAIVNVLDYNYCPKCGISLKGSD